MQLSLYQRPISIIVALFTVPSQAKPRKYRGIFKVKSRENHGRFGKTGLNKCSISKSQIETEPGVQRGKHSLLACRIRRKYSMETICNSVKVKLGIKVMQLVKSRIGKNVTVTGRASECHLTFAKGNSYRSIRPPDRP